MLTIEALQKRIETFKNRLRKTRAEHENEPCADKVRAIRKRVKRNQRKLRAMRAAQEKRNKTSGAESKAAG